MKSFPHILSKLLYEPLLITQAKYFAICRIVEARMTMPMPMPEMDDEQDEDEEYQEFQNVAVIPVHGILGKHMDSMEMMSGGCDLDTVKDDLDIALADESIERIIFDFRSPGGSVTGIPELAGRIASIQNKETVAFTDSECCSGALWLATQCDYFYATESANVGSIGVWCAYLDVSRQMQNDGENMQAISAGKYKLMGAYWKPLSDEEKKMLQKEVDQIHAEFKSAVNLNREIPDEFMQGQIFDGREAAEIGLTDGIVADIEEVLEMPVG
jgi:signal peptide peptidase SppA